MTTDLAHHPPVLAGTWSLDPTDSAVTFALGHTLHGTLRARFGELDGALFLHPRLRRSRALLLIEAASVYTGRGGQDEWLRSAAFLDARQHPYLCLHSTDVRVPPGGDGEQAVVSGELAIRDVARPFQCLVRLSALRPGPGPARARIVARLRFERAAFGLGRDSDRRRGGVLLGDEVTVDLDLTAVRQSPAPFTTRPTPTDPTPTNPTSGAQS
jgi:polyisoprenoid-binding protein YceI